MNRHKYFKLYACCILVKGTLRSGICDLQRSNFETIPNSLFNILQHHKNEPLDTIIKKFSKNDKEIICKYYEWLIENEFGFWCDENEIESFPELNIDFHKPNVLTNAIIDINNINKIDYKKIFNNLIKLAIPHIEIRAFVKIDLSFYLDLLKQIEKSRIKTIDIITPVIDEEINFRNEITIKNGWGLRLNNIVFYNSTKEKVVTGVGGLSKIIYSKQKIVNSDCCGKISPSFFSINLSMFTESNNFNTCLNRKISIDVNGEIKNCPSMQKSYGNIKEVTLKEALNKQGFKDLWKIKKDDIKICKDCEFRHICTDCRAFIDDSNDIYSHPAKCEYNPYQAKWKADEGYIPVTEMTIEEIENIKAEHA